MNGQTVLAGVAFISQVSIISMLGIGSHTQIMAQERSKVNHFTTFFFPPGIVCLEKQN